MVGTTKIKEIVDDLRKQKEAFIGRVYDDIKKRRGKRKIESVSLDDLLEEEQGSKKLKTGTLIDDLIGDGLDPATSMLLYGEFGAGKSQTCFTMAVKCPDKVIYIDTEHSLKLSRLKAIGEALGISWESIKERLILYRPRTWIEQMMILSDLPTPMEVGKIGIIIVDSLTKLLRGVEFSGRQSLTVKQPLVREFIQCIEYIVEDYQCAFIYTTQIYESPNANPVLPAWMGQRAVGGASVLHQPDYVVFLRKSGVGSVRIARLIDASNEPIAERPFIVGKGGIMDLPETSTAEKLVEKTEKWSEKQQDPLKEKKKKKEKVDKNDDDGRDKS